MVHCEPPVPQNQYLPPSSQYGAPNGPQAPSSNYGPPRGGGSFSAPPSSSYGAPAVTSAIFSKPQTQYGPPGQQQQQGGYGGSNGGGYGGGGYGGQENYGPAKYEFQYDVQDYQSGQDFGHMESRDGDKAVGRYYVLLPDGRKQIVNYEADEHGYRPTISYEQTNNGGGSGGFGGYDSNAQSKFNGY